MAQAGVLDMDQTENEDTLRGRYLIFAMGSELYGIEIRYITEIIGIQSITNVPEMPEYIKGIMNLRGKIIPVMDARARFKKQVRDYDDRTCIIVLNTDVLSIGLIVDRVSEVLTMQEEDIAPPPGIGKDGRTYVKGIGKAGGDVKLLLDCTKLLSDEETEYLSNAC